MEKINVAELLKDCPEGMELDCTMYENVYFGGLSEDKSNEYPITVDIIDGNNNKHTEYLTKEGYWSSHLHAKCVIFPKGKTTWEGFQRPFKEGDIISDSLATCIFKGEGVIKGTVDYYCGVHDDYFNVKSKNSGHYGNIDDYRLATEEEKQKLFDAIKKNGYQWNAETKTLIRSVFPEFCKGDWVIDKQGLVHQIENVVENVTNHTFGYDIVGGGYFNDNSDVRLWTIQDAKDGDVLAAHECLVLFKKLDGLNIKCYCTYHFMDNQSFYVDTLQNKDAFHPATEEEKKKLFDTIKDNGYKWNAEDKILEKLVEPKFHKGQWITDGYVGGQITSIEGDRPCYKIADFMGGISTSIPFTLQDNYHLWTIKDAKDGDVLVDKYNNIGIFQECVGICWHSYIYLGSDGRLLGFDSGSHEQTDTHPATEEEKKKLFDAIKANGYHWNEETKTLEKFPIFKVGDRIQGYGTHINHPIRVVKSLEWDRYRLDNGNYVKFGDEHAYKLLKFDITTLVPFESRVLMRSSNAREWTGTIFSHYSNNKFYGCGMCCDQCIPYEGNERLLGKTDDCDEFYRTWEKTGD